MEADHNAENSMNEAKTIGILVDDMFFASKINGAAEAAGSKIVRLKSREQLEQLATAPPSIVIIDLSSNRIDPLEAIKFLKSTPSLSEIPVVSFVSHVQTELIRRAQAAGCDYTLPRSAFDQMLAKIVSGDLEGLTRRASE
jgi:DNA-binding NarL/FixJ family response regulator